MEGTSSISWLREGLGGLGGLGYRLGLGLRGLGWPRHHTLLNVFARGAQARVKGILQVPKP